MDVKRFVVPLAAGVVIALAFGLWWVTTRHTATADVVEGWAMPNATGTAISLHDSNNTRRGNGYVIAGARWAGRDEVWHDGADGTTCIGTDTTAKTRVRLGIVDVEADEEGAAGPHVVWVRCLD